MLKRITILMILAAILAFASTMVVGQLTIRATVLLIDTSGSMNGQDRSGQTKIDAAKNALNVFINSVKIEQNNVLSTVDDRLSLIDFDDSATVYQQFTNDYNSVISAANQLVAGGATNLYDGLLKSLNQIRGLQSNNGSNGQSIILLTDGVPTATNSSFSTNTSSLQTEVLELARELRNADICLYVIPLGDPNANSSSDNYVDVQFLRDLVNQVNANCGGIYFVDDVTQLASTYINIRLNYTNYNIVNNQTVTIQQNQTVDFTNINVQQNQQVLRVDTIWDMGTIGVQLFDPAGILVDSNYPGAFISAIDRYNQISVQNPQAGNWTARLQGLQTPQQGSNVELLVSNQSALPNTQSNTQDNNVALILLGMLAILSFIGVVAYLFANRNPSKLSVLELRAHLVVATGATKGQTIPIATSPFTIGRGNTSILRLRFDNVSRTHAQIIFDGQAFWIQDNNSKGGTFVNGQRIFSVQVLQNGDMIKIGDTALKFNLPYP